MKGVLRQLPQDAFVLDAVFYSVPAVRFATAESASRRSQAMIYSSGVRFTVRNPEPAVETHGRIPALHRKRGFRIPCCGEPLQHLAHQPCADALSPAGSRDRQDEFGNAFADISVGPKCSAPQTIPTTCPSACATRQRSSGSVPKSAMRCAATDVRRSVAAGATTGRCDRSRRRENRPTAGNSSLRIGRIVSSMLRR